METYILYFYYIIIMKFKSYYVVWKLNYLQNKVKNFARFKSYYVVWKQI